MKKDKLKKFLSSKIVIFLLLLAFIWLSLILVRVFYKKHQIDKEIGNLKSEIAKMDKRGQELSQLLDYFSNESYLEKEAKEKLNLKKEGETVVMVQGAAGIAGEGDDSASLEAAVGASVENSNLVKWWNFFFKR